MPVPTGTATPWRELQYDEHQIYVKNGVEPGTSEFLAEALRADGVVPSLGPALKIAEETLISLGWYGYRDDGSECLCDEHGETTDGEYVEDPIQCVVAIVNLDS